ncbi:hypothetical protein G3I15_54480, partial [Streptomyces sp. SID10244]|nr:hypothetical protein [Streptomyces sp. SID10244]
GHEYLVGVDVVEIAHSLVDEMHSRPDEGVAKSGQQPAIVHRALPDHQVSAVQA